MNERQQVFEELKDIAMRYGPEDEQLYALAGVLFAVCAVLSDGDLVALLRHLRPFSEQELRRLQSKNN